MTFKTWTLAFPTTTGLEPGLADLNRTWTWTCRPQQHLNPNLNLDLSTPTGPEPGLVKPNRTWNWICQPQQDLNLDLSTPTGPEPGLSNSHRTWTWTFQLPQDLNLNTYIFAKFDRHKISLYCYRYLIQINCISYCKRSFSLLELVNTLAQWKTGFGSVNAKQHRKNPEKVFYWRWG